MGTCHPGRRSTVACLLLFVTLSGAGPLPTALGNPLFDAPAYVFETGGPYGWGSNNFANYQKTVAADLNGDARADLVSIQIGDTGIADIMVLSSHAHPRLPHLFRAPLGILVGGTVAEIVDVEVADTNGDGQQDIILLYWKGDSLRVWLHPEQFAEVDDYFYGHGPYTPPSISAGAAGGKTMAVGDLDGDLAVDLLVDTQTGSVRALLGNGDGTFSAGPISAPGVTGRDLADMTGDGVLDLIGVGAISNMAFIYPGTGTGAFGAPIALATASTPKAAVAADVDGDTILDLAVACPGAGFVSLFRGFGGGLFSAATDYYVGQDGAYDIAAMDLDGNSRPELVVTCSAGAGIYAKTVSVLPNNGFGGFGPADLYDAGGNLGTPALGDFDADGDIDIAAPAYELTGPQNDSGPGMHTVSVLLNDGMGRFGGARATLASTANEYLAFADVNRDGKPDLIAEDADGFEIHPGNGAGGFSPYSVVSTPAPPEGMAVGDLDRNGTLDLVASGAPVQLGNGDGTFAPGSNLPAPGVPFRESLVDLDRDGILDLVLGHSSGLTHSLEVVLGDGTGAFGAPTSYALTTAPRDIAVSDWNRDGKSDLAVATDSSGALVFAGDGTGALTFTVALGNAFISTTRGVIAGDWNRDGKPDLAVRRLYRGASMYGDDLGTDVYFGDGGGNFARDPYAWTRRTLERDGGIVGSWDANRDGHPDLITTSIAEVSVGFHTVGVHLGSGGQFSRDGDFLLGQSTGPGLVAVGDIDRNGELDLAGRVGDPAGDGLGQYATILRAASRASAGSLDYRFDRSTGASPVALAAGDLNRDGILDVVALGSAGGNGLHVHFGVGDGTLAGPASYGADLSSRDVECADLDRDGLLDVVVAGPLGLAVRRNTGGGGLSAATYYVPTGTSRDLAIAVGDVDRDGLPDVVGASPEVGSPAHFYKGNGDGSLQAGSDIPLPVTAGYDVALADMNRDGWLDLVLVGGEFSGVTVVKSDQRGGFETGVTFPTEDEPNRLAIGDVNRDGKLDVAVAGAGSARVRLGDGMGGLGPTAVAVTTPGFLSAQGLSLADGNHDGLLDLFVVTGDGASNFLSVWQGDESSVLGPRTDYTTRPQPYGLVGGDFDRDGRLDIATAAFGSAEVSIFLHGHTTTAVAEPAAPPASRVALEQNWPNPFNPRTTIRFTVDAPVRGTLRVYDVKGRSVVTLAEGLLPRGEHRVFWDGRDREGSPVASGVYFYRLETGAGTLSRRMVLLK